SLQLIAPDRANTHRDQNDERRERQAEERERWKVVEQAAAMPRDRSAEAADVMLDEETLDEAAPFLEQNHHVPRQRDDKEDEQRTPVEHRAHPGPEVAAQPAVKQRGRKRHEDGDRPL